MENFRRCKPPETFFRLRILTNSGRFRISVNKTGEFPAERGGFFIRFDKIDKNLEICQFCQGFGAKILTGLTKKRKVVNFVKAVREDIKKSSFCLAPIDKNTKSPEICQCFTWQKPFIEFSGQRGCKRAIFVII